jgi:hypothetical protein
VTVGAHSVTVWTILVKKVDVVRGMVLVWTWVDLAGQLVTSGPHWVTVTISVLKSVEVLGPWPMEAMAPVARTAAAIV